jgi:uncharacterized protein (TIGR02001 family)
LKATIETEKPSPHQFTGFVKFVSDWRRGGIDVTYKRPAVQGELKYTHTDSGYYLKVFGSNLISVNNASMNLQYWTGFDGDFRRYPDFNYQVGIVFDTFPGAHSYSPTHTRPDSIVYNVFLGYKSLQFNFYQFFTNFYGVYSKNPVGKPNGNSRGSIYIALNYDFDLFKKVDYYLFEGDALNLSFHIGEQLIRNYSILNYTDWKVSLTQNFGPLQIFVDYVGDRPRRTSPFNALNHEFCPKHIHQWVQCVLFGIARNF